MNLDELPHTALGIFQKDGKWNLMVIKYNNDAQVEVDEVIPAGENKFSARDMFKVEVIKRGLFKP